MELTRNRFTAAARTRPLWLPGGHFKIRMTWDLPVGAEVATLPEPAERQGPAGLFFRLAATVEAVPSDPPHSAASTVLVVDLPSALPASSYEEVRAFFQALQQAGESVIVVRAPARR